MSKSIAAIHVAKKQLGLDDDTYRAALLEATGKSSSSAMTEAERQKALEHFRQKGFKGVATGRRKLLEGRFAPKLQALWIAGWNLGLIRDRDDRALIAFVKRQTGLDHVRFLRHGQDATKAIEALKGWLERSGGVDWKLHRDPVDCVLAAQVLRLRTGWACFEPLVHSPGDLSTETVAGFDLATLPTLDALAKQALMNQLGDRIRALPTGGDK